MTTPNTSAKKTTSNRNPVVQVVLKPDVYTKFSDLCKNEQRSESSMGAIIIANALSENSENSNSSSKITLP